MLVRPQWFPAFYARSLFGDIPSRRCARNVRAHSTCSVNRYRLFKDFCLSKTMIMPVKASLVSRVLTEMYGRDFAWRIRKAPTATAAVNISRERGASDKGQFRNSSRPVQEKCIYRYKCSLQALFTTSTRLRSKA